MILCHGLGAVGTNCSSWFARTTLACFNLSHRENTRWNTHRFCPRYVECNIEGVEGKTAAGVGWEAVHCSAMPPNQPTSWSYLRSLPLQPVWKTLSAKKMFLKTFLLHFAGPCSAQLIPRPSLLSPSLPAVTVDVHCCPRCQQHAQPPFSPIFSLTFLRGAGLSSHDVGGSPKPSLALLQPALLAAAQTR